MKGAEKLEETLVANPRHEIMCSIVKFANTLKVNE